MFDNYKKIFKLDETLFADVNKEKYIELYNCFLNTNEIKEFIEYKGGEILRSFYSRNISVEKYKNLFSILDADFYVNFLSYQNEFAQFETLDCIANFFKGEYFFSSNEGEEKDGEYVLHFKRQSNLTPFLHELGHIVHDCLVELGFGDAIYDCYSKNLKFDDESEYFVSRFLGYIRNNVHDEEIEKDLRMDLKIKDDEDMNKIFDKFFRDTEYDDRMNFLRYMIETPL
jgi:hypothetical protein